MMHEKRVWCLTTVGTAEELAGKLTDMTWAGCTPFKVAGHDEYLFLNDAPSADAAQEYAIVKLNGPRGNPVQIDFLTFGWCDYAEALRHVQTAIAGQYDEHEFAFDVAPAIESPEQHGQCPLCA